LRPLALRAPQAHVVVLTASGSIATYLKYKCGHAAMVSLPRIKGERPRDRDRRLALEKISASQRGCDFCASDAPTVELAASDGAMTASEAPTAELAAPIGAITGVPESEEPSVTSSAESEQQSSSGRERSPLRKLSDEQELELTRLYSDTETPVPDIARRFGVGESSVYRISQRHGAGLRGRVSATAAASPVAEPVAAVATPNGRRRRAARGPRKAEQAAAPTPGRTPRRARTSAAGRRTSRQSRSAAGRSPAAATQTRAASGAARRFRVVFLAETVIEATSIRDAIAQAEAHGATDITSVTLAG